MIRAEIPDHLLADWFVKSLLPSIAKDVALSGVVTEEQVLLKAQQLDLVYFQSIMLYEILPNAPRFDTDPTKPASGPHVDRVIGSVGNAAVNQVANQMGQMSIYTNPPATTAADRETRAAADRILRRLEALQNRKIHVSIKWAAAKRIGRIGLKRKGHGIHPRCIHPNINNAGGGQPYQY